MSGLVSVVKRKFRSPTLQSAEVNAVEDDKTKRKTHPTLKCNTTTFGVSKSTFWKTEKRNEMRRTERMLYIYFTHRRWLWWWWWRSSWRWWEKRGTSKMHCIHLLTSFFLSLGNVSFLVIFVFLFVWCFSAWLYYKYFIWEYESLCKSINKMIWVKIFVVILKNA